MSWQDQGRQCHMWFGHGSAADNGAKAAPDPSVIGQGAAARALALAYAAVASLPAAERRQAEAQYHSGTLPRLREAMTAWMRGTRLDQATFAARFFGRGASDPVARSLRRAALGAATAESHGDLREAAGKVAKAMKAVGIQRWPRFVADAQARARDPATQAAVEGSELPPDPARDAIRPVYPVETILGIGAAGVMGGAVAALRAAGGAIMRQVLPESRLAGSGPAPNAAGQSAAPGKPGASTSGTGKNESIATTVPAARQRPQLSRQKQDGHISGTPQNRNRARQGTPTSTFDGDANEADALTQEAWDKGAPVPKRPGVRDYDFGRRIGTGPNGGGQSTVRVHQDAAGKIHGHPSGPETP